ncbi:enoyl-CoA hydratase/isomerase family protein [Chloroflexota bacterium]
MRYETLLYRKTDQIGNITLNRPKVNNAINERLAEELVDLCSEIQKDSDVRVVTITGTGKRFCTGTNSSGQVSIQASSSELQSVATIIAKLNLPVIAAVNGDALGQGLELALACDIRIASKTACFGFPQIISGLIPWDGGTQRLPRLVGRAKAIELILTGEPISSEEAFRVGLVAKIVGPGELSKTVTEMAQGIASRASTAIMYAKEAVNKGLDVTLEQGLRLEADLYFLLHTTEDRTEGIRAFHEKRRPKFKGK